MKERFKRELFNEIKKRWWDILSLGFSLGIGFWIGKILILGSIG